jgi:hypothetical protein
MNRLADVNIDYHSDTYIMTYKLSFMYYKWLSMLIIASQSNVKLQFMRPKTYLTYDNFEGVLGLVVK